ncbi:MAG: four helix bundle protein [Bacteroidota bacterium]
MKQNLVKEKSFEFSLKIILLFKTLKEVKEFIISKQLLRSGTSIGANIAESEAAQSRADFVHKLSIASKEARETHYWLELLDKSQLVKININTHIEDCDEIIRLLTSIIKTIKSKP